MIVVDTNIIGYLYLSSPLSPEAERTLLKDPDWAAPLLWRSELRNVLALYLRKRYLAFEDARRIMEEASNIVKGREYEVSSNHVLELAATKPCSAYDCEFVALARDLKRPLVTVDKLILKHFPDVAVALGKYVSD